VVVTLCFLFRRPKGVSEKTRPYPITRPDLSNLEKGLSDSWNGILFGDDAQIVKLNLEKHYAADGRPGVAVSVETV